MPTTLIRRGPSKSSPARRRGCSASSARFPAATGVIDPVDRKQLKEWPVARGNTNDAESGELVRFELARGGRAGVQTARVTERLGNPQAQRMTSLIAVHAHGIPDTFPDAVLAEAAAAKEPELGRREDLRHLPLVTIDPSDARDHDDAVWAEADPDPKNHGGWVVIVAIADVASYVRPGKRARQGSAEARQLGLFPRPRRADAAGAHLERPLLAEGGRAARLPRRAHGLRQGRTEAQAPLLPRIDALGREPEL